MCPAQSVETREATVGAEPRGVIFKRVCRQVGVRDVVAARIDVGCELTKQHPMPLAGAKLHRCGSREQSIDRLPRLIRCGRLSEDPAIRHDAHETTEHDIRQTEGFIVVGEPLKQRAIVRMFGEIGSVGITTPGDLDLKKFNRWLGDLLTSKGPDIFRMKGVLSIKGARQGDHGGDVGRIS